MKADMAGERAMSLQRRFTQLGHHIRHAPKGPSADVYDFRISCHRFEIGTRSVFRPMSDRRSHTVYYYCIFWVYILKLPMRSIIS